MAAVALQDFPVCQGLSPAEVQRLKDALEPQTFPAKTQIFHQGEQSDAALFVEEGTVSICIAHQGHKELLAMLPAGSIVGEIGLVLGQPRSVTTTAETEVRGGLLSRTHFRSWLERSDPIGLAVLLNIIRIQRQRLIALNQKFVELTHSVKDTKVLAELTTFRDKLFGEWRF